MIPPICPACNGEQIPDHPAGILVYKHRTPSCTVQALEDARMVADKDRALPLPARPLGTGNYSEATFTRPATATERTLLISQGYAVPVDLSTNVEFLTRGVRNRTWPTLTRVVETTP